MFLENITQEQIQQFRQAFALFDKDGDGCINNKQLKTVLRSLGHNPTKEQLEIFTSIVDQDRSGTIDFRQFLILISQRLNDKTLFDEIIQSFKVMDKDNDGFLTRIQIKEILHEHGFSLGMDNNMRGQSQEDMEDKLEEILEQIDHEGEGNIDIVDFVTYVIKNELKLNN